MADTIVIKVKYSDIIRRFRLPKNEQPSFDSLESKIRDILHFPHPATLAMTYVDSDGDHITMASDDDFAEAVLHQGLNPLILNVKGLDGAVPTRNPSISSEQSKADSQEVPTAATNFPKKNSASNPAAAKTQNDLADMISQQLARALGDLHGEVSGLESHVNNAFNESKFKVFLESAPSKLAEVLQAAARSGFDATFEPIFVPSQVPAQKSAQPQTASSPASSSEGVNAASKSEQKSAGQAEEVKKVVHHGVECDVCGVVPISGIRFKSLVKEDYDLCEKCFPEYGKEAEYKKIEQSLFFRRSGHPFCRIGRNLASHAASNFPNRRGLVCGPLPYNRAANAAAAFEKLSGLDARFVKDVNIFDGTEVAAASKITKIWRFQNSGLISWPQHTRLMHVGGQKLGEQDSVSLEIGEEGLSAGKEIEVSVDMTVPQQPGRVVSHWRLATPGGLQFGQRVWAMVQVVDPFQPARQTVEMGQSSSSAFQPTSDLGSPKMATETTAVDDISVVEHSTPAPTPNPAPSPTPALNMSGEEKIPYPILVPVAGLSVSTPTPAPTAEKVEERVEVEDVEEEEEKVEESGPEEVFEEVEDEERMMVQQLVQMGFTDEAVNVEVLKKQNFNLQRTLDELVTAAKWDGALNALEEMGFSERGMNLSLLYKFDGNSRAVVRALVQKLGQK